MMQQTTIKERIMRGRGKTPTKKRRTIQGDIEDFTHQEDELIALGAISAKEETSAHANFMKEVLDTMQKQNISATPINYSHFFYKILLTKDDAFQTEIENILHLEKDGSGEDVFEMEKSIRKSYESIRELLMATSAIIKLIGYIKRSADKNIFTDDKKESGQKQIEFFKSDLKKVLKLILEKEDKTKKAYRDTAALLKEIQNTAILNHAYEVHSKQYLFKRIEQEIILVQNFKRSSCFMLVEIDKFFLSNKIHNEKLINVLRKVTARILKRSARKSDCIGYYDKGYFGIVLPHTNISESEVVAKRILHNAEYGSIMIGKHVQNVKLAIGITPIFPHENINEVLVFGMNAIDEYYKNTHLGYGTYLGYCSVERELPLRKRSGLPRNSQLI